jgi:hypothetical protein
MSIDRSIPATLFGAPPLRRPRGRPLEMSREEVLARIRALAESRTGLFRVHHVDSRLYARSRRLFGSWSEAVRAAGIDYQDSLRRARDRARRLRRIRVRRTRAARSDARIG